jgi:hypothetical protein
MSNTSARERTLAIPARRAAALGAAMARHYTADKLEPISS